MNSSQMLNSPLNETFFRYNLNVFKKNVNGITFSHLNINSIRSKFDIHSEEIKGNADIFSFFETRLKTHFLLENFQ